jgi:hypothetical protein
MTMADIRVKTDETAAQRSIKAAAAPAGYFMKRAFFQVAAATFGALVVVFTSVLEPAHADDAVIIRRGDAVVTGYSGTKTDKDVPADVHPLDRTFIDLGGTSAQVFDLSVLGTGPRGQVSDVPSKLQIKAADVGQVFGVTLDDGKDVDGKDTGAANAYLTSTSMFGLYLVAKSAAGKVERVLKGSSDAAWMPGQFGFDKGGTPGAIWKVDGRTGAVSLFANIKVYGDDNSGAGLGNITFDPKSRLLFVTDLEAGMIHSMTLDGKEKDVFDHGVFGRKAQGLDPIEFDPSRRMDIKSPSFNSEDPATWGYADARRRVFGIAVNAGRLYYSVAEGPSVWSISVDGDGDFSGDARIELEVKDNASAITDVLFDGSGMMFLAQRGNGVGSYDYSAFAKPQQSAVLRYKWDAKESRWAAVPDEYAIGLGKDFRATQGGVASNYGYDKNGNIDYGKCRQTLWSTGEHLRETPGVETTGDIAKVSLGGAKIVHGLQGNYKSRVRPANEPPFESWFTDYDSRDGDAEAFGHIGDVAIFAPCDPGAAPGLSTPEPSTRVEPPESAPPPLQYIDPPADVPSLIIDKHCFPGAIGGKIRCAITVSNVGTGGLSEDVKVKDVTKVMFGPLAGTVVPISTVAPFNPGITCSSLPSVNFACTIPAVLLGPGLSSGFDVFIDTHDLALAGNLGFRNCASIHHPAGWVKACAEGGTDIVVEKIGPAFCLPGLTCKFGLKIANAGTMPFDGDLLLADAMFVGGAVTGAPVTAVNPPIACFAGNTTQLPFTCVSHLSLMPGEEHVHWVDVTMPAPGGYWAHNCFGALDPSLVPVGPVPPGLGGGGSGVGNPSCVWVHVPVPKPNLKLVKTALHGGKCAKVGADLFCDYEIKLINENNALFSAPVKIDETVPVGASIAASSAPWACAGGPPAYTCDTGAPVNIAAGGSTAFNVTIKIPVAVSEASMCIVPNKAKINIPAGGLAPNIDATDDESAADAWTFGLFWEDPITHITFVMCDPTNLKVAKTAKGPCKPAGGDFDCEYAVTVTNTGPDPYKGPVKLDEKFGLAPTTIAFNGDFTCAGGGANYNCETPVIALPKGASLTLNVKAKVPATGVCELPNTATMTFPPVGSKGNGKGDDDSASATANVPSPSCGKVETLLPLPPKVNRCPDGRPIPRSGKCPCENGGTWNVESNSCDNGEPKQPEGCKPGIHEVKTGDGRCICREGFSNVDGRCVKDDDEPKQPHGCTPGEFEYKTKDGRCVCNEGAERVGGHCVVGHDEPKQPQGCEPGDNEHKTNSGRCVCDEDYERSGSLCVRVHDEPQHPEGCQPGPHEYKSPKGRCVCDDGFSRNGNGRCVKDSSPEDDCNAKGWNWTGKRCVPPSNPAADCKNDGRVWTGSKCIDPPKQECPDGTHGNFPNCKKDRPEPPVEKHCPKGMIGEPGDCHWPKKPNDEDDSPPPKVKHCPRGMIGEPGDCHWPKKPKNDDDDAPPPKKKFPKIDIPIEIFKPKHHGNGDGQGPRGDGPYQPKHGPGNGPGFNFKPGGMFKKFN